MLQGTSDSVPVTAAAAGRPLVNIGTAPEKKMKREQHQEPVQHGPATGAGTGFCRWAVFAMLGLSSTTHNFDCLHQQTWCMLSTTVWAVTTLTPIHNARGPDYDEVM